MKILSILLCLILFPYLSGCMGTDSYYNAQTEYYKAQSEASKAYITAMSKPVAEMTAPDGTRFIVNNTNIQSPVIKPIENPIVAGLKTVVNSTPVSILSGGWAAKEVIKASTGDAINNSVTDNSATATPTVVNQPAPLVVTQPAPLVLTQPEPKIITQPEPIVVQKESVVVVKPEVVIPNQTQ